jgi:drug/metabolite transporter (DMT)-like permease
MDRLWIIVIGGLLPALAFGISAIFQKGAVQAGIGAGTSLFVTGLVMAAGGLALRPALGEANWGGLSAIALALVGAVLFAVASGAINFALVRLAAPVSLIAPITVISSLVTVVAGFVVFREYEGVRAWQLLCGALLVVGGAALVATS